MEKIAGIRGIVIYPWSPIETFEGSYPPVTTLVELWMVITFFVFFGATVVTGFHLSRTCVVLSHVHLTPGSSQYDATQNVFKTTCLVDPWIISLWCNAKRFQNNMSAYLTPGSCHYDATQNVFKTTWILDPWINSLWCNAKQNSTTAYY